MTQMQQLIHSIRFDRLATLPALLLVGVLAFPLAAYGEKLNPKHLSADATWVVHCNFDALSETAFAQEIRNEKPNVMQFVHQWFQQQYGIDPPQDLHSLTMFSDDYRPYTGVVVVRADYDPSKVEAKLRKQSDLQTANFQNTTLYTVTLAKHQGKHSAASGQQDQASGHDHSGGKQMTVVMVDEDTLLLASSIDKAKETLQVLSGDSETLETSDSQLLANSADDALIYGAAINLQDISRHDIAMPVLQQHETIRFSFGQRNGMLYEQATLTAQSQEVAEKMKQVLEGLVAYKQLWAHGSDSFRSLVDSVKIDQQGNQASFTWQGDSDTVVAALDDVLPRVATWNWLWQG